MDASSRPWPPATTANRFETTFSYIIPFGQLKDAPKRVYSPWHLCAGFKWRLLIFPHGNNFYDEDDFEHISIYLDCGGPHTAQTPPAPSDECTWESFWRRPASFALHLLSPSSTLTAVERSPGILALATSDVDTVASDSSSADGDAAITDIVKDAAHVFCKGASDWGFSMFAPTNMMRPSKYAEPNGDVTVMVNISFQNTIRRTRFKNRDWDSRKETGFVGLKNQGITDYLNVLLQMMYAVRAIHDAVYHTPKEKSDPSSGEDSVHRKTQIVHALQSIFTQMKESPTVVATNQLTDAFQWTERDCFYCRTVIDFQDTLVDWYADRVNSTDEPDPLTKVYEGKEAVHCERGDQKNGQIERSFYALSLNVEENSDLTKSFTKYTEMRTFEDSETEESQERKEYIRFARLPRVLLLQLKRLRSDGDSAHTSERVEFPKELDLCRFVEESDGSDIYVLHAVVVHDGDYKGGYYSVFIRPELDNLGGSAEDEAKWFEFDDEIVRPCTEEEAVERNFGGETGAKPCAWVLQYLRKSDMKESVRNAGEAESVSGQESVS